MSDFNRAQEASNVVTSTYHFFKRTEQILRHKNHIMKISYYEETVKIFIWL